MSGQQRRPGDPYKVGRGKPPEHTRFKKGVLVNPYGRPRKKPDLYSALKRVLNEMVTVTIKGAPQRVTVQQALLMRLRDQALLGKIWASKLVQKVIDALPEGADAYDHIEMEVGLYRSKQLLRLMDEDSQRENADQPPEPTEAGDGE